MSSRNAALWWSCFAALLFIQALPGSVLAQEPNWEANGSPIMPVSACWQGCDPCACQRPFSLQFTPYGWFTQMKGDVTIRNQTVRLDVDFDRTWDLIWGDLNFMFFGQLEANYDRWGLLVNGVFASFSPGGKIRRFQFNDDFTQTSLDTVITYELTALSDRLGGCYGARFEVLAGTRFNSLTSDVTVTGPRGNTVNGSGHQDWFDPIVGVRYRLPLNGCWTVQTRGDVGGFNWAEASTFTWNIEVALEYRWRERLSLMAGYRWLDIDRESGQGSMRFAYDVMTSGPMMGLTFRF